MIINLLNKKKFFVLFWIKSNHHHHHTSCPRNYPTLQQTTVLPHIHQLFFFVVLDQYVSGKPVHHWMMTIIFFSWLNSFQHTEILKKSMPVHFFYSFSLLITIWYIDFMFIIYKFLSSSLGLFFLHFFSVKKKLQVSVVFFSY